MEQSPSTPPPVIMVNDRVLVHYAVLNDSVGFSAGHGLMFVGDKEISKVPCLAICQDRDSPQFMLYYCDSDWSPIGIASYDSVDAAKRRAERIYPGSIGFWKEAHFTEADANRFLNEQFADMQCSFCGKKPYQTTCSTLFEGEGHSRICGDCVTEFNREIAERSRPGS